MLVKKGRHGLESLRSAAQSRQSVYQEALVLVVDGSGSMQDIVADLGKSKTEAVRDAVEVFTSKCSRATHIGLVKFGDAFQGEYGEGAKVMCSITDNLRLISVSMKPARAESTYLMPGLILADRMLLGENVPIRRMIVLSDGNTFDCTEVLRWAQQHTGIIDTVFFGSKDELNGIDLMTALAKICKGEFHYAATAPDLVRKFLLLEARTRGLLT